MNPGIKFFIDVFIGILLWVVLVSVGVVIIRFIVIGVAS